MHTTWKELIQNFTTSHTNNDIVLLCFLCCYTFLGEWRSVFTQCTAYDFNSIRLPTCLVTCWYLVARIVTRESESPLCHRPGLVLPRKEQVGLNGGECRRVTRCNVDAHTCAQTQCGTLPPPGHLPPQKNYMFMYLGRHLAPDLTQTWTLKSTKFVHSTWTDLNWPEQADPVIYTALFHRRIW